jgi:hypothetical protein
LLISWVICYSRSKAPRFVRYCPIVALVVIAAQTVPQLNQLARDELEFVPAMAAMTFVIIIAWLFCAVLGWQATTKSASGIVYRASAIRM